MGYNTQRRKHRELSFEKNCVYQRVKSLTAVRETRFRSLGQEDLLEKEMRTHPSIPAWEIPWTERGARQATAHGVAQSRTRLRDFTL